MQRLVISICTRERPKMMLALLQSCTKLVCPDGISLSFIIVENGPEPASRTIVDEFSNKLAIRYVHQTEIGVVRARNRAIELFLEGEGDWLAFIDDDEVIDENWAVELNRAMKDYPHTNVFSGMTVMTEPLSALPIFQTRNFVRTLPNRIRRVVSTQNVIFRRMIFDASGRGMRFDMRLNTVGGSDVLLSMQLSDSGEKIMYLPAVITRETIPEARAKFRFRTRKWIAQGHHAGLIALIHYGWFRGHMANLYRTFQGLVQSLVYGLLSLVVIIFNEKRGLAMMGWVVHRFCNSIGRPQILWKPAPEIYHVVQGY